MEDLWSSLKKGLTFFSLALFLLFLLVLFNETGTLYRNAYSIHPYIGYTALVLVILLFGVLLGVPFSLFLSLKRKPQFPESSEGEEYKRYLLHLKERMIKNPALLESGFVFGEDEYILEDILRAQGILRREADRKIRDGASSVFLTTAISQNGSLDGLFMMVTLTKMIYQVARIYYQKPTARELVYLYSNVFGTVMLARSIEDLDLLDEQLEPVLAGILGGSLGSLLPGTVYVTNLLVNSITEGSMNTFLYLRVGAMAKKYSESLVKADKKEVRRSATLEAVSLMGSIVRENSGKVVKAFAKAAKGSAKKIFRGNREKE
ncbi:DUF697 domain-containing protein [Proteiniclasticum ruminis]|uniref:DUF697 domain-containing protein n=1 Tax=Proteiniclasticum ruminis TaxID=398199 RepID=UPI00289A51E2|nr:DUF697 domain-containing protein [Proteiniclasticum ruminis]